MKKVVCKCCKKNPPRYYLAKHCSDCFHALLPCCKDRSNLAAYYIRRRGRLAPGRGFE